MKQLVHVISKNEPMNGITVSLPLEGISTNLCLQNTCEKMLKACKAGDYLVADLKDLPNGQKIATHLSFCKI